MPNTTPKTIHWLVREDANAANHHVLCNPALTMGGLHRKAGWPAGHYWVSSPAHAGLLTCKACARKLKIKARVRPRVEDAGGYRDTTESLVAYWTRPR